MTDSNIVPFVEYPDTVTTNKEKYIYLCKEYIKRDGIDELLKWLEASDFFEAPASTRFHGNYEGGLCEHSLNVYSELRRLKTIYGLNFSEETMAIAALFHDLCKANFYKQGERNVKDKNGKWYVKPIYEIDEKLPLGHGEKSCIILQWFIRPTVEELLAIRWHMGGFDSSVKGGAFGLDKAQEASPLVCLLNVADTISSNLIEEKKE